MPIIKTGPWEVIIERPNTGQITAQLFDSFVEAYRWIHEYCSKKKNEGWVIGPISQRVEITKHEDTIVIKLIRRTP